MKVMYKKHLNKVMIQKKTMRDPQQYGFLTLPKSFLNYLPMPITHCNTIRILRKSVFR